MSELIKIYYRKHAVSLYKTGHYLRAFQILQINSQERGDLRSLLYLGWMLFHGQGCPRNYKLSARVFRKVMEKKGTQEAEEASKLLALVYTIYNKPGVWIMNGVLPLDLRLEDSFL